MTGGSDNSEVLEARSSERMELHIVSMATASLWHGSGG